MDSALTIIFILFICPPLCLSDSVKTVDRLLHLTTGAVPIICAGLVTEVVDVVFSTGV